MFSVSANEFAFLLLRALPERAQLEQACGALLGFSSSLLQMGAGVCVSEPFSSIDALRAAYDRCSGVLCRTFREQAFNLFFAADEDARRDEEIGYHQQLDRFFASLQGGSPGQIDAELEALLSACEKGSVRTVRSVGVLMLVRCLRILREINPDIVAWVYMPGTVINYPVAHKDGDSEYYLHHNFSLGEGSFGAEFGSIMLSGENAGDFSDEVNILYGHHMRNGSMFALFAEFRDSAIFNEHRTIYLLTPEGNYRLQTFAVEHVPMTHSSIATPNYPTDEEFTAFKDWLVEESVVTPDPDTTDTLADATKLFGFCTCDGADNTWRYITFADVAEFVPISYVGTDTYQGDTAVEDDAAGEIAADAQERAEG